MCKLAIPVVVPSAINELTLTNSVLHYVVLDETTPNNLVRQTLAINCHCHIVSFVRFGRPSISKSKLINTLLSDSNHETFFNENCPLGTTPKTISQGIIEAAWFLPSRETKNFDKITMFLNLRGNSQTEQTQLQLLSRISSVMVILVDLDTLQDTNTQDTLHNLQTVVTGGVVLALDAYKYDSRTSKEICQKYSKQIPEQNMKTKLCPLAMNKQNVPVSEVKRILLAQLSAVLKKTDAEPLSTRIVAETDTDFKRNKDSDDLRKAREKATDVLKQIPKEVIDVKKLITPLQGEPWHIWSENSKIINRASKCTSPQERSSYQEEMKKQRQLQLKTVENMHEFMQMTIDTFEEFLNNDHCFGVVTEWMKLMLNDRSRTVTSNCLARYQSDCQTLELAKGVNKDISEAEEQVKKSKSNLNSAPFRFEHLMRECGQIFESVETCKSYEDGMSNATEMLSTKLPKIAAKLLLLEGLRSQRYDGTGELRHDNMLATFVIGLGDITIVNVKGENTSEVKDILQIAVHAFLRLKLVNKKLNLKQSCLFIHQNVSDAGAISKMLEERQIFVQSLDEMAKAAAEQEDVADIQTSLAGDPPMAPVNPGYCKRVGEVRNTILNNLASKRKTYLTITDTITRIKDIWNGILKDDFVYSFRNSLELKAYNEIERVYHAIVWELEKFQYEFVSTVTMGKLSQECIDNLTPP
ncbi:unnamed protein product [Mytilus edulis]|uniref:VLIG-type G domain-containing protein n=1 Tax=Mytilus edulis TaxID=6550 RepID=A0A8S3V9U9_MYTED|nr:unnamed protein product [Mytilus edulis]